MRSALPSVSVLIANCNGKEHLGSCLPSLLAQSYPNHLVEIIVVDNGSADDSVVFLRTEFPSVRIIENSQNEGFAKANNQAAEIAAGRYLALINNDMVAKADWLEHLVATQSRSGAECVGGVILNWDGTKIDFVDAGMTPFAFAYQPHFDEPAENLGSYLQEKDLFFACGGSMLIDREIFLTVGAFDEDFFCYYEDVDLGNRLWVLGYRIVLAPHALTFHRHNGSGGLLTADRKKFLIFRNRMFLVYKNYEEKYFWKCLAGIIIKMVVDIFQDLQRYFFSQAVDEQARDDAMALVEAFLDFIRQLHSTRLKREEIQANRKKSDGEIFTMLEHPDVHIRNFLKQMQDFFQAFHKAFSG